jgi:hypothetical protein
LNVGTESNVILKELISISIWFIPVYLFSSIAVFVPFLSEVLRKTFAYSFALVSLLLSLNNFSLLMFNFAFLIDTFGFNNVVILFVLVGLTIFVSFVKKQKCNRTEALQMLLKLLVFVLFLGLVQGLFAIIPLLSGF